MLDNPEKTITLLAALKNSVPFEVQLTPPVLKRLEEENVRVSDQNHQIVSDVSYAGDEGGIMCHILRSNQQNVLVISLTHVRVPRSMPLSAAITGYQKHRVKKLKKQESN
jgi:hypothetical protein